MNELRSCMSSQKILIDLSNYNVLPNQIFRLSLFFHRRYNVQKGTCEHKLNVIEIKGYIEL